METNIKTRGALACAHDFKYFIEACKRTGNAIGCNILEITIYQGWAQAAFQTDKFGGVAAIVNDFSGSLGESYTATYPGGGSKLKVFPCLDAALAGVAEQYKEEAEARSELAPPDAD